MRQAPKALRATLDTEATEQAPGLHAALAQRLLAEELIEEDEAADLLEALAQG